MKSDQIIYFNKAIGKFEEYLCHLIPEQVHHTFVAVQMRQADRFLVSIEYHTRPAAEIHRKFQKPLQNNVKTQPEIQIMIFCTFCHGINNVVESNVNIMM